MLDLLGRATEMVEKELLKKNQDSLIVNLGIK